MATMTLPVTWQDVRDASGLYLLDHLGAPEWVIEKWLNDHAPNKDSGGQPNAFDPPVWKSLRRFDELRLALQP